MYKIWPMGCKKIKNAEELEAIIDNPDYAAQVKIDGVRCILHVDGDGAVRFTTRGASVDDPGRPIEITHRLTHLCAPLKFVPDSIFDGELYSPKYTSAEVSGMISHKSTVDVDPCITLNIFDCLRFKGNTLINKVWTDRMWFLMGSKEYLTGHGFVVVPYVTEPDDKRQLYQGEIEANREGAVFKNKKAKYVVGKSKCMKPSGNWYKAKKHDTVDVVIVGSTEPEHYYRDPETNKQNLKRETKPWQMGWIGSIDFMFQSEGVKFYGSCSGLSDSMKTTLSDGNHGIKDEYIGRWMEVEFMEKTSDGNLRHPRFVRIREEEEK